MSTTDELLEEMLEDAEEYATPVTDDDLQFWIDEHLRVISIPKNGVVAGVEGDKNVNKIKFGMNRYYHGFDMSTFSGRILYSNAKGNKNYYNITDMQTNGNTITFSWLVDADAVQYMGKTAFVVYLFKTQGSELRQKFYSTLATLNVLEGMEVDSAVPVEKQTDIIERMKEEISAYAEEVKKSLPADYTAMTEQVSSLKEEIDNLKQNGATTTIADGSVTPEKTDFLTYKKAGDEWGCTLEASGYLGVATVEYLDVQDIENITVLVTDTNYNPNVYIACYDKSQSELQGFTVVSELEKQRVIDIYTGNNTASTVYVTKTPLKLTDVCVKNTRYIKVKVAQYKSTDDSSIKVVTGELYNGENYVEWNDKYENNIIKDSSVTLRKTDFVTYNNPNLIDYTNFASCGYTSNTEDMTHTFNQFGGAYQIYFKDYIDVSEKKSVYIRAVRSSDTIKSPFNGQYACYDSEKKYISRDLVTTTHMRGIGSYNTTVEMDDGHQVVKCTVTVDRIDIPDNVSYIRFGKPSYINSKEFKYLLVSYDDILNVTAINEKYEKVVSDDWKEAVKSCFDESNASTGVFIGDSLTDWGGGGDETNGFLKIVHDKTGLVTKNEGYAGATWQDGDSQTYSAVDRINTIISEGRTYDLYCFMMGTNGGSNVDTGETSADTTTMCGAIRYCMEKLKAYHPTAHILVCLPPQRAEGNENQEQVNKVIKAIVESYSVKTLDVYHHSGIVPNTTIANIGYLSDGLHLGENGITMLGNLLASEVKYLLCF